MLFNLTRALFSRRITSVAAVRLNNRVVNENLISPRQGHAPKGVMCFGVTARGALGAWPRRLATDLRPQLKF